MHALVLLSILATSPPGAPVVQFSSVKPIDQIQLGKRVAKEIRQKEKVLPQSDIRVKILRKVGMRVLSTFKDKKEPWEYSFDVIESKDVNAFALPGGPTFFFTGLLDKMKTEDELAAVIGHELTHVRKQHWAIAYVEGQRRNLLITGLLILTRANRTVADLAGLANEAVFDLPFSRANEVEADTLGYDAMVQAHYNPQGMVDTFETLRKLSTGGGKPPEFLSSHPDEKNRIARVQKRITDSNRTWPKMVPLPWPTKGKGPAEKESGEAR